MKDYILHGAQNHIHDLTGFNTMKLIELKEGFAKVEAVTGTGFANTRIFIHGGALMTLCDMTASAAVYSYGKRNVTLQSSFNFTHGISVDDDATMTCEATVVHNGRQTVVVDVVVKDRNGRVCVKATFTQFVVQLMTADDPIPQTPLQMQESN